MKHLLKLLIWFQNISQAIKKLGITLDEYVLYYNIY